MMFTLHRLTISLYIVARVNVYTPLRSNSPIAQTKTRLDGRHGSEEEEQPARTQGRPLRDPIQ